MMKSIQEIIGWTPNFSLLEIVTKKDACPKISIDILPSKTKTGKYLWKRFMKIILF